MEPVVSHKPFATTAKRAATCGAARNGKELDDVEAGVAATALALVGYPHAKARLIAQGMDRDRVEKMAVGQVIAIYTERVYRKFSDDYEKLWYMPFADMNKVGDSVEKRMYDARPFGTAEDREIFPIVSLLIPAIQAAREAQVRVERDVAALRVIEALRMFASDHDGKLPKTLDEITAVPVPNNPATGKPFKYRLERHDSSFGIAAIRSSRKPASRTANTRNPNCREEVKHKFVSRKGDNLRLCIRKQFRSLREHSC